MNMVFILPSWAAGMNPVFIPLSARPIQDGSKIDRCDRRGRCPMPDNPEVHRRRSLRLKGYDHTQIGMYFVTTCV